MGRESNRRLVPELTEDQLAEMEYLLAEALESGSRMRITLFGPEEDEVDFPQFS